MKKFRFISFLFLMIMAGILCSCDDKESPVEHIHDYGTMYYKDLNNHWKECPCGEKGNIREHSYGDWIIMTEATETTVGSKKQVCVTCGYEKTESIPQLDHVHKYIEGVTNPTCTEGGYTTHTCSACGDTYKDSEVAALGHTEVKDAAKAADCENTGLTEGSHCSVCKKVLVAQNIVDALGHEEVNHDGKAATCTEAGWKAYVTCSRCDYTTYESIEALDHNIINHDAKAPTCEEIGWDAYETCSRCDYTTYEEIAALGHTPVVDSAVAAKCETTGLTEGSHCDICEKVLVAQNVIPALTHKYGEWTEVTKPTLTTTGLLEKVCINDETHKLTKELPLLNNEDYAYKLVSSSTCTVAGSEQYTITVDGQSFTYTVTLELKEHNYESIVTDPTCEEKGYTTHTCSVCGDTYKDNEVEASGHDYDESTWIKDVSGHWHECTVCNAKDEVIPHVPGEEATEENAQVCTVCNHVIVPALNHVHVPVLVEVIEATCTTAGNVAYYVCGGEYACGKFFEDAEGNVEIVDHESVIIAALGHTEVKDAAKTADCENTGLTEGSHCSVCSKVLVAQEEVAALGHNEVDHEGKAATCENSGWEAYVTCSRCSYTTYKEIEVLGHTEVKYAAKDATCLETGLTEGKHCSVCSKVLVAQNVVPALGHEEVNHNGKAATCTEAGWKAYVTCSRCDYTTYEAIETLDHNIINHDAKAPTCEEIGWDAYKTCSRCSYTTYKEIAALGHTEVKDAAKDVTCLEIGLTEGSHCLVCEKVLVAQKVIPALGHDYNSLITNPTCEDKGYTTHTCNRCNDTYVDSYVNKLGHYMIINESVDATCEETGLTEGSHCLRCDYKIAQEVIPALGHDYEVVKHVDATCEEDGYIMYVCSHNTIHAYTEIIPTNGHSYDQHLFFDNVSHWYVSNCAHSGEKVQLSEHNYINGICKQCNYTSSSNDFLQYELHSSSEYYIIISCDTKAENIVIPYFYNDLPIKEIDDYAFLGCSVLKDIYINGNISRIGRHAFSSCISLENVDIENGVQIIDDYSFYDCSNVIKLIIPDSVTKIGEYSFSGCVKANDILIGNGVSYIGSFAFENCKTIKTIVIPDSVTHIGEGALSGCYRLYSVTLPFVGSSKNSYGSFSLFGYIFGQNEYSFSDETKQYYTEESFVIYYLPDDLRYVKITGGIKISEGAFEDCSMISGIELPNTIISIENRAFHYCSYLTTISIPDSVKEIGSRAFYNCGRLIDVNIGINVTTIGAEAFKYCSRLTNVTMSNSVTTIGYFAFSYCDNLTNINLSNNLTLLQNDIFYDCPSLKYNEYRNGCYLGSDSNPYLVLVKASNLNISACKISDQTKFILEGAFKNCTKLTSIDIPMGITEIRQSTFLSCTSLINVTIPSSVQLIDRCAFYNCSSLLNIVIPNSVMEIETAAFYGCSSLVSISLPFVGKTLNDNNYAFGYIFGQNDSDYASYVPSSLIKVIITGEGDIRAGSFGGCNEIEIIELSNEITGIGERAFYNCTSLRKVLLSENIETIGQWAFYNCTSLIEIELPNKLKVLDDSAFNSCGSLTNVIIPSSVTYIGNGAFYKCFSLNIFCIVESQPDEWYSAWNLSNLPVYWAEEWEYDANGNPVPLS